MDDPIEPYEPLRTLAPGLHVVDGDWGPLRRRMTVLDVGGGDLAVHSAVRLREDDLAALDRLGRVRWVLVPNRYHGSEAGAYGRRYPEARVLVPRRARAALEREGLAPLHGTLEDDWPAALAGRLERAALDGLRDLDEVVFFHPATRTLVLTDLCFNLAAADLPPLARLLMRLNGAVDRFGPTRLARAWFFRDRRALAASLAPVLAWDVERVIVSHGRVLEAGGGAALRAAFAFLDERPAGAGR